MRLIDADELIKQGWVLARHGVSNYLIGIKSIADVPTAFDLDNVLKRLDELDDVALKEYNNTYAGTYEHDFADGKSSAFETAIEIVKNKIVNGEQNIYMSDIGKYRNEALDGYTYNDLVNYGYDDSKEDLIPESVVKSVIDNIESDVNVIRDMLESIRGLSEIEEIKEMVNNLSEKLY